VTLRGRCLQAQPRVAVRIRGIRLQFPCRDVNVGAGAGVEGEMTAMVAYGEAAVTHAGSVAFAEAYPRLFAEAYRVAYRLLGVRAEAEDVAQESCARAYSRWRGIVDYAEPWCVRVAGNLALDLLRARARAARRAPDMAGAGQQGPPSVDRLDLYRALAALPKRQREVVVMRYLGDQSEEQTAALLGVSVGTVKTHASRGIGRLREVIQP
jgi:RNA polymerase sigma-70 factor (sigma-E family)